MNFKFRKNKGFTLIELLVVISIISLISSIVLATLNDARSKARDSQRLSDMRQLQNALELYYSTNGNYIEADFFEATSCGDSLGLESELSDDLVPSFISKIPRPLSSGGGLPSCYIYESPTIGTAIAENGGCGIGKEYALIFNPENYSFNLPTYTHQGVGPYNGTVFYCLTSP